MNESKLRELRVFSRRMGCTIAEDHLPAEYGDEAWCQEGYWLIDVESGNGVWPDNNFSTSLKEVEDKLKQLASERGLRWDDASLLTDIPLTWGDIAQAHDVVSAAIERIPEDAITEEELDHLNTAMAWLKEAGEEYQG